MGQLIRLNFKHFEVFFMVNLMSLAFLLIIIFLKVNDLTRNITKLEKELAEKERYVALSQMRLGNRAQRVGIELCKDKAQDTLIRELMALKDTYQKLSHMIDQVCLAFNWKSFQVALSSATNFIKA